MEMAYAREMENRRILFTVCECVEMAQKIVL